MPRFFPLHTNNFSNKTSTLKPPKILSHDGSPLKKTIPPLKKPIVLTSNMTLMQLVGGATNFNRMVIEESKLIKMPADVLKGYYIARNPPEQMLCLYRDPRVLSLASFLTAIADSNNAIFNKIAEIPYYYFFRTSENGLTPLEIACLKGNLLLVRLILDICKEYPPIDGLDNVASIWQCAIKSGKKEIVQELLDQSKHCISLINVKPQFVIDIAEGEEQKEIYKLFEKYFEDNHINTEHDVLMTSLSATKS